MTFGLSVKVYCERTAVVSSVTDCKD